MNPLHERFDTELARQIDRLVDGELAEPQRRQLLLALDAQPDGWRRCALAFLEGQSWQHELRGIGRRDEVMPVSRQETAVSGMSGPPGVRSRLGVVAFSLATAAGLLVAFGLGWSARSGVIRSTGDAMQVAGMQTPRLDEVPETFDPLGSIDFDADPQWGMVTLSMGRDAEGNLQQIELPVLDCDATDLAALERESPVVPIELRAALERLGHRVSEQRRLVTVSLEDGRQVVVPVDEIELSPVPASTYQ